MKRAKQHRRTFYKAWEELKKEYNLQKPIRTISAGWTIKIDYDLHTTYGLDVEEELIANLTAELDAELLREILNGK